MTSLLTSFKTTGRAALVALTLGATALTATPPVQAQSGPSFSFRLELDGGSFRFGIDDHERRRFCLTDRQIRRGLRAHGFTQVRFVAELGRNRVEVRARFGRWVYRMRVNRCTGRVDRVQRIRRINRGGGGFGLHFDFGM